MNRVSHLADRAALVSLKLLAALNVLAFLCALGVALLAVSRAHAADPAPCVDEKVKAEQPCDRHFPHPSSSITG